MAKDTVFQARMDKEVKQQVEELYRQMGTTFSEAVRLFAQQSLLLGRMPFEVVSDARQTTTRPSLLQKPLDTPDFLKPESTPPSGFGMFSSYADEHKRASEPDAWSKAATSKHGLPLSAKLSNKNPEGK